jgi:hypothetical protein
MTTPSDLMMFVSLLMPNMPYIGMLSTGSAVNVDR